MTIATPNPSPQQLPDPAVSSPPDKLLTPEDLLQLPDEKGYELVDGKLVERHMGAESSEIAAMAELARRSGVRPETLNRLEKGKHSPDTATLSKISKTLRSAGANA